MVKKSIYFLLVVAWLGSANGAPLAPDSGSLNANLNLWLRMPEVNYDPGTGVWTDLSGKGNDASVSADGFVGPTLSSGENTVVFTRPFGTVHFDPTAQDLLKATNLNGGAGLTDLTIFHVIRVVVTGGVDQRGVGFGAWQDDITADCFNPSFDMTLRKNNGSIGGKNQDLPLGEYVIYAARMDASSINMWLNTTGTLSLAYTATGSSFTTGTDQFYLGDMRYSPAGDFDIAEVVVYNAALTDEQIEGVSEWLQAYVGTKAQIGASAGSPADGATDVSRNAILSWTPVATAVERDVYFGTVFEDVNTATRDNPLDVLASQAQEATSFDPGTLDLGQTYHWRIDEVNAPPDSTIFPGAVWNFTVEPVSYALPIGAVIATASSMTDPQDPNNTVNGSGLDPNTGEHSNLIQDMWISDISDAEPWIQFEFEKAEKLDKVHVWNHNSQSEGILGFGTKEALISYSDDGETWSELGTVEIAQAPGGFDYTGVEIPLDGVVAQYIKVTALTNWSLLPAVTQKGLSEVRFYAVPVYAREPQPADGEITDGANITLQWRAGREAVSHEVLLSDDPNTIEDGSAVIGTTEDTEFQTGPLSYDTTYFWQIVEVNEAATPAAYAGKIWQFTTPTQGVIDDMESYQAKEGLRIWEHWIDGFDNPDENGSVVGNGDEAEKSIVHGGSQSLPLAYNNNSAPKSEATRTFDAPLDLTASDVQGLVLYFHGSAGNTGGSLYVKIDDARVLYDSDAGNLQRAGWSKWFIPLADVTGTDLTQVTSLTIGVDNGGQGMVYVDDIVVTPESRELVTPVDPGADGLVSHYAFEGNAADSTGQHPGTVMGFALYEQGAVGQAISLAGLADNYVEITGYKGIVADADGVQPAFSVACWFNTSENGDMVTWGSATGTPVGGQYMTFRIEAGNLRTEHGDGNIRGNTPCNDGEWHHGALTVVEGASLRVPQTMLYIDGQADGVNSGSDNVYNVTADADLNIGQRASHADRWFPGLLDEVMLYDRVLSAGEVAALAGRTLPFDKP